MIAYYIEGRAKNVSAAKVWQMLDFATEFLGLMRFENLWIELQLTDDFQEDVYGYCNGIDDDTIEIEISRSASIRQFAATLFHELVHARQILEGRLVQGECGDPTTWDGVAYHVPYDKRPWEIEAHALEEAMMRHYDVA